MERRGGEENNVADTDISKLDNGIGCESITAILANNCVGNYDIDLNIGFGYEKITAILILANNWGKNYDRPIFI